MAASSGSSLCGKVVWGGKSGLCSSNSILSSFAAYQSHRTKHSYGVLAYRRDRLGGAQSITPIAMILQLIHWAVIPLTVKDTHENRTEHRSKTF